ncbi:hypothetical protein H0H92_016005, partial [Tricholoma furcatifolium]
MARTTVSQPTSKPRPSSSDKENEINAPGREARNRRVSSKIAEQMAQAAEDEARKKDVLARRALRQKKSQIRQDKAAGITQDANASDLEPLEDSAITSRRVPTKISLATTKRALEAVAAAGMLMQRPSKVPPAPTQ